MKNTLPTKVFQIKITLDTIRPPIWRRVLVPERFTLLDIHNVIQDVFDWWDYHLHEFKINSVIYGDPANDEFDDYDIQDETNSKLPGLGLEEGSRFTYQYDFGDNWFHTLEVEKILPAEKALKFAVCLDGKRARPPEDVGGISGYTEFLKAIRDPRHEEHASFLTWVGGRFDPEAFDLPAANERLRQRSIKKWAGNAPQIPAEEEARFQILLFEPSRCTPLLTQESKQASQSLPLRQDGITFLTYIKENKVTGTQSTGNLPLKAVKEITRLFWGSHSMEALNEEYIDRIYSEEQVLSIYFVHSLAQAANLVDGGPGRMWKLTAAGEKFLSLPAHAQVAILFAAWWYRINWAIFLSYDWFSDGLPEGFAEAAGSHLRAQAVDQPILFEPFADKLIQLLGWSRQAAEDLNSQRVFRSVIEDMLIDPTEKFGVLSTHREKDAQHTFFKNIGLFYDHKIRDCSA